MTIKVTTFMWENETKPEEKLKKASNPEVAKEDDKYIYLDKEKTIMIKRSPYTEDMVESKSAEDINTKQ